MAYDVTTTPAVGDATKRSDYTRLRDSIASVRQMNWGLGGSLVFFEETAAADTYVDVIDAPDILINGSDFSGLSIYLELNAMANALVAVTITARLYNVTTAAAVSGSEVALVFAALTATTKQKSASSAITLAAGNNYYRAQIKRSVNTVGAAGRVRAYAL